MGVRLPSVSVLGRGPVRPQGWTTLETATRGPSNSLPGVPMHQFPSPRIYLQCGSRHLLSVGYKAGSHAHPDLRALQIAVCASSMTFLSAEQSGEGCV